jgi:hypothetical protein
MKIAKIVSSNSHIDYVARVIDDLDVADPPSANDYGFGRFVGVSLEQDEIVGVIYDSKLINPEYANYGPRLSPKPALGNFSPDYINEQGILIGILLLGTLGNDGSSTHGVPTRIVPPGGDVAALGEDSIKRFHTNDDGQIHIHYYSQIVAHAGQFAVPLLDAIIGELSGDCSDADRQRLSVLKQTLKWQGTLGGMKL